MIITKQRYTNLHSCIMAAAAAVYIVGIFDTKILQPGIIIILGVCCFNMLHLRSFTVNLKNAAFVWLLPFIITQLTWTKIIEFQPGDQNTFHASLSILLCTIPFLLLFTGKPEETAESLKRIVIINIRIIVQTLLFMVYLMLTAVAWIKGTRIDLIYWALFHILATALFPFFIGRVLCGWICPNATIQDGIYKNLNFKGPIKKLPDAIEAQSRSISMSISGNIDQSAPYVPFTLLATWFFLFFIEIIFQTPDIKAYSIFFMYGVIVLSFLFPWRKFCTHFCWIAGYKCMAGHASLWRIRFNRSRCRQCKSCNAEINCPFSIDIKNQEKEMPVTCCLCFECMDACPFDDVITFRRNK